MKRPAKTATARHRRTSKDGPATKSARAPLAPLKLSSAQDRDCFPIVGVGASAGGLEAFTQLLKHLPLDTGLGFVLVQHLDPKHESALTLLLTRATSMPVREVTDNLRVEPNHIYVIPPNRGLSISEGFLRLHRRHRSRTPAHSIDAFFESLAQNHRERAIGVILSGTATDGTLGLEAIKAEGGITFAQDDSAKYDSMPRSAIAAGCVDFVLKPEDIASELARIARHPYVAGQPARAKLPEEERAGAHAKEDGEALPSRGVQGPPLARAEAREGFRKILFLLRNHSGVDFSLYKSTTIQRRIARRTVLNKHSTMEEYAGFLRGNAKELGALYSDVLISVTSFFRNPEAFDFLKEKVFPKFLQRRGDEPFRVWVLGCSTGQEAYSLAIAFMEAMERAPRARNLQVFATDLNEALLEKARHGLYARTLAQDVSPERLRRFFVEEEAGYRVAKPLRDAVVFARQNLISDPPFSRMDLISCRNLLIYLEPSLQKKAIPTFHYALKPEGFLFLGASESIGEFTHLFEPADKRYKIFSRKPAPEVTLNLPVKRDRGWQTPPGVKPPTTIHRKRGKPVEGLQGEVSAQREADRVSVNRFAPPGVLINSELQILQFRGPTSSYLQPPPTGKASFDVLKMAREGLMLPLRAAIKRAKKENQIVRKENIRLQQNGSARAVSVEVIPLKNLRERCFLVLFEDARRAMRAPIAPAPAPQEAGRAGKPRESGRINALEIELAETRDYLQSIQEQHEAANEELQASNEEVQSANEELQSINEELETSKEELESSNEELTTVNEEMANRNTELNRLNSDLSNLQSSTKLPIVLLARDLTIRRFSAPAEKIFNLLATDVGRPLGGIRHNLVLPRNEPEQAQSAAARRGSQTEAGPSRQPSERALPLEPFVREVIDTVREREREVCDKNGRWYSLRARPYMTEDNKIDGAVLVLVDIDELKRTGELIRQARDYAEATIRTARDPLVILGADLRVDRANEAFYKTFKVSPKETENRLIYELGGGQWKIPKLRELLEGTLPQKSVFNDFEVTHDFERIGRRTMLLNARRLDSLAGTPERILLGIEDVTEKMLMDEAIRRSEDRLRSLVLASAQVVWTTDAGGLVEEDSASWRAFTGQSQEQRRGWGWLDAIHPDDRASVRAHWLECVANQRVWEAEYRLRKADGGYRWTAVRAVPILNADGGIREWIGANTDITERKEAEEARKALNEQLAAELAGSRRLQETSTLLIHGGDLDALYQQILEAATAIMQSDMASLQILEEEGGELRLLAWRGFHPKSAAYWKRVPAEGNCSCGVALRAAERVIIGDVETIELMSGTPDLEECRRSGIRAVQSTPLISRSGPLIGMISTHWRKSHQPDDRELRLLDVLARQAADLVERNHSEQALAHARKQLEDRAAQLEQLVAERTASLQDTIAELEHFSYTITHDMRAPLRSMQGFSGLLLKEFGRLLTPQGADYLRRIVDATNRMDALIRDSLQYAKTVRERLPLAPVAPAPVLRGILESYPTLQAPRVEIQLVEPLPLVMANEAGLAQCFSNLLANAVKFVKPDQVPRVRIWAERRGEFIRFWFDDNGIGIPSEYHERIFGMFQQLDKGYEGTGIGLALVRKTAERMNGKVGLESEPGTGSRFWLECKSAEP